MPTLEEGVALNIISYDVKGLMESRTTFKLANPIGYFEL